MCLFQEGKGAEDFLPQVENFAKQVAESLLKSNDASLNISQPNIGLKSFFSLNVYNKIGTIMGIKNGFITLNCNVLIYRR
jgi:hypothetical protein